MNLWLDDTRDPQNCGYIGFEWVKTADEAIALLKTGKVEFASLDHDLTMEATLGRPAPDEKTGWTVLRWMWRNDVWPPKGVRVHSQNPRAVVKMQELIDRHYGPWEERRGTEDLIGRR